MYTDEDLEKIIFDTKKIKREISRLKKYRKEIIKIRQTSKDQEMSRVYRRISKKLDKIEGIYEAMYEDVSSLLN